MRIRSSSLLYFWFVFSLVSWALCSCTKKTEAPLSAEERAAQMAKTGRSIYLSACTACHNPDPKKDGPVGPAIAFSSFELVEKRVVEAAYPAGYRPKRDTHTMVALPHLKGDVPAIHAYLNSL